MSARKGKIYMLIGDLAKKGKGVIVISSAGNSYRVFR